MLRFVAILVFSFLQTNLLILLVGSFLTWITGMGHCYPPFDTLYFLIILPGIAAMSLYQANILRKSSFLKSLR